MSDIPDKLLHKMEDHFTTAITMHDLCRNGGFLAGAEWMWSELKPLIDAASVVIGRSVPFGEDIEQEMVKLGILPDYEKGLHYDGDT